MAEIQPNDGLLPDERRSLHGHFDLASGFLMLFVIAVGLIAGVFVGSYLEKNKEPLPPDPVAKTPPVQALEDLKKAVETLAEIDQSVQKVAAICPPLGAKQTCPADTCCHHHEEACAKKADAKKPDKNELSADHKVLKKEIEKVEGMIQTTQQLNAEIIAARAVIDQKNNELIHAHYYVQDLERRVVDGRPSKSAR